MEKNLKCHSINIKVFIIFFMFILTFFLNSAWSATYYMPDDFSNLHTAFAAMRGGDTLIIRDGAYTGPSNTINSNNRPPNGTIENYTTIKAEHPGHVSFGTIDSTSRSFEINAHGDYLHYVIEGITWYGGLSIYDGKYAKIIQCAATSFSNSAPVLFAATASEYILFEDCYAWGGGRYKFLSYESNKIIYRRCVARIGAVDTTHNGRVEPIGAFAFYKTGYSEAQNCIVIDSDTSDYWTYLSFAGCFANPNNASRGDSCYFRGCIALNNDMAFGNVSSQYTNNHKINCVGWDLSNKMGGILRGEAYYNHCTFGNYKNVGSQPVFYSYEGYGSLLNSIIYNVPIALQDTEVSNNNCLYANGQNYNKCFPGENDFCIENNNAIDPIDGNPGNGVPALKYLPRIEKGSDLSGKASDGGDIGATILYKIGRDGALWGEPGYNEVTNEPLWPFPNEDLIKQQMSQYSYDADGDGNPEITGKRGFCANGTGLYGGAITLTSYIWEYLGHQMPSEIYGGAGDRGGNQSPVANAGPDQTLTDNDNNGSEMVTLDGSSSYDSDGSITSYTWTENGQSIASEINPSVTLSVGTHQIQLTVTDNQGGTSQDTVQVVVSPAEGDNSPPVISNVQASNISSQTATITWVTDEPSSSNVEYGTSSSYGQTANSANIVTTHSVSLSGLQPSITYHYRVSSTDSSGNPSNSADFTFTTSGSSVQMHTLQDFEDGALWVPGRNQDTTGNGRGWAFLDAGPNAKLEIDSIGANGTHHSLKITFDSDNPQIYFRSDDRTRDHMPEAKGANRMSFYIRFPEEFPIQQLPFRYDTWQLGTFIHDPHDWNDTHRATSESDHGIHHYYHRVTIEKVGNGWVKYIINTHPDQANYSGSTVPPDRGSEYFNNFGRFYFHFGPEAGGPDPGRPFTIWIDEIKFYYDDGSVGGQVHDGGQNDAGFDGQFFPDSFGAGTTPPTAPRNFSVE